MKMKKTTIEYSTRWIDIKSQAATRVLSYQIQF